MIYRMTFTPMLEEYGKDVCLSPAGILKIFENTAMHHANSVGDSVANCLGRGEVWFLTDWYVEIYSRVPMGLRVKVETFCRKGGRVAGLVRDFLMQDGEGNLIARATSRWARVDAESRRLLRVGEDVHEKYGAEERSVFDVPPSFNAARRVDLPVVLEREISLRRSDFDMHEHVHNLQYLDFALEAIPREAYRAHKMRAFHISYLRPICAGDRVVAKRSDIESGYAVSLEVGGESCAKILLWMNL